MVRSLFERWQRLEQDKAAISDDLKELFQEAKGQGFDTKALRLAFRQKVKAEEATDRDREVEALVETYLDALDGPRAHPAPARVETIEEIPPHNPETGEIAEPEHPDSGVRQEPASVDAPTPAGVGSEPDTEPDMPDFMRRTDKGALAGDS